MTMLGAPCSPCCKCNPCSNLKADCLEVTFSGFAHSTDNCNECSFLDDTKIVMERKGTGEFKLSGFIADTKGSGATVSVTTTKDSVTDYYTITGVTLTAPGSGYTQAASFGYTLQNGVVVCGQEPSVNVVVGSVSPVLSATASGGSGAELSVVTTQVDSTPGEERWGVYEVSVKSGGSGYSDGAKVTFSDGKAIVGTAASATVSVARSEPSFNATISENDRFASATLTFTPETVSEKQWWRVTSAAIGDGFYDYQYGVFTAGDKFAVNSGNAVVLDATPAVIEVSEVDQDGKITKLDVTAQGAYYSTDGSISSVNVTNQGSYYRTGGIQSVELIDGGKFSANTPCVYTGFRCGVCAENYGNQLFARFTAGASSHTLTVFIRDWVDGFPGDTRFVDTTIAEATKSHDGSDWGSSGFVFAHEDFLADPACLTTGTATVKKVDCTAESEEICDMPEQITLSLSGMGRLFLWASQNGGSPGQQGCPEDSPAAGQYETFCGLCDGPPDASLRGGGTAAGVGGYSGALIQQDFTAVLDLQPSDRCFYTYSGYAPSQPTEFAYSGQPGASVSCGGDLAVPVTVTIGTVDAGTSVSISSPTKGQNLQTAAAEVTKISGGVVESISVIDQGSGYATEIMERVQPTITATSESTNGTDAKLSVQLSETKDFNGNAIWTVESVTVDDGGTGYVGNEPLTFEAAEGDTSESPAFGSIVVGRTEPTVTASVASGSGATLGVSLTKAQDFNGLDVWSVSGVTVADGGAGYSDGESVSFAVSDGVQVYSASATTKVGRDEPDIIATIPFSAGSGAALSASLTKSGDSWYVSGVTITSPGSGYSQYDNITFDADPADVTDYSAYGYVSEVDQDGAVTAIAITSGGSYYKPNGIIESVSVTYGGEYYKSTGVIESVILGYGEFGGGGGSYYRLDGTGEVDADTPTVTINSLVGSGATATATVDVNLESPTFGQITAIAVANGGSGYLLTGRGWIANVVVGSAGFLYHLDIAKPPFVLEGVCENRANSITTRTTTDPCPNDLLNRQYKMFFILPAPFGYGGFPEAWDYCAEPANGTSLFVETLFFYGMESEITCTLASA